MKGTPVFPGGIGHVRFGRLAVATAAFAWMATAAGCASSSSQSAAPATTVTVTTAPAAPGSTSASTPSTPTSTPSPPMTGPPACPTSSLRVKQGVAQGYAGGVYEVIDFTNTSGRPCSLYGYPGVSLVSGPPYTQIGLAAKRTASTRPKLVTLAPAATANALLQIVDALNYPSASCGPTKATALKIYPPNQTVPVYLPSTSNGCAKSVQIMYIGPVQPGSGSSS
jgi:Domain of unknown function (DUF4232)